MKPFDTICNYLVVMENEMTSLLFLILLGQRLLSFHFGQPSSTALGIQNPQDMSSSGCFRLSTPPKTDMAPENRHLAKEIPRNNHHF